jgi:hypothetical protein
VMWEEDAARTKVRVPRRGFRKPWDVGNGQVAATVGVDGAVLSVHGPHPYWGWVHLSGFPPFDEAGRFDPDYVRRYRRALENLEGEGLRAEVEGCTLLHRGWLEGALPVWLYAGEGLEASWTPLPYQGRLFFWLRVRSRHTSLNQVKVRFRVRWRLHAAAYGQITEGGPLPRGDSANSLRWKAGALLWEAPGLPAWGALYPVYEPPELRGGNSSEDAKTRAAASEDPGPLPGVSGDAVLEARWEEVCPLSEGFADRLLAVWVGSCPPEELELPARQEMRRGSREAVEARCWQATKPRNPRLRSFVQRQLCFVLDCCAVTVDEATALVTDPVLLPLSWNRDAYYLACLLGSASRFPGPLAERARRALLGHLRWLFWIAHRPDGWWGRSHLTGGAVKDPVFQLDQQWYPLLELARAALDWGLPEAWSEHRPQARRVAEQLLDARHPNGLWPTAQSPADDPLELPYHFSSHVLAWRTLALLSRLDPSGPWAREGENVRDAVRRHFVTPEGTWAYATDGRRYLPYHDANDLPTACAARWGFVDPEDRVWRRTVQFAWSPCHAGFFPGRRGGLGSVHAPGPWTLGDLQHYVVGCALQDGLMVRAAWRRLREVAADDQLLPESYDPDTGAPRTRVWFAWPGAAAAALLLGDPL